MVTATSAESRSLNAQRHTLVAELDEPGFEDFAVEERIPSIGHRCSSRGGGASGEACPALQRVTRPSSEADDGSSGEAIHISLKDAHQPFGRRP